jgi:hypothetical protein
MSKNTSRFVAVNLTDAEWLALRAVTPDPCAWIKTQIRQLLDESGVPVPVDRAEERDWSSFAAFAD